MEAVSETYTHYAHTANYWALGNGRNFSGARKRARKQRRRGLREILIVFRDLERWWGKCSLTTGYLLTGGSEDEHADRFIAYSWR